MMTPTVRFRSSVLLFVAAVLTAASGSQCHRRDYGALAAAGPRVLSQSPSLGDVMQVVNANAEKIRSLYTTDAALVVPGTPQLRVNLALERPRRMRLRAETALSGPEIDLGSNDERFWFWVRRNPPPTLYYCRHDQWDSSTARQAIPIDPYRLFDAVVPAAFDPAARHTPPQRTAAGRWEIRSTIDAPRGAASKTTVVDEARGWVLQQLWYDERGMLIADAVTNRHTIDAASGAVVPQEIELRCPAVQFQMKLEVRQWIVNSIPADPQQLFTMPSVPGWGIVDLADPGMQFSTVPPQTSNFTPTPVGRQSTAGGPPGWGDPRTTVMGPAFAPPMIGGTPTTGAAVPLVPVNIPGTSAPTKRY